MSSSFLSAFLILFVCVPVLVALQVSVFKNSVLSAWPFQTIAVAPAIFVRKDSWGTNVTCLLPTLTLCGRSPECRPFLVSWACSSFSPPVSCASPQSFHHLYISLCNHSLFYFFPCCLLISMFCCCRLVSKSCLTPLRSHGLWPTRLFYPWDFPGKNTGVGCHFLLQGIFPTQRWGRTSYIGRQILYH